MTALLTVLISVTAYYIFRINEAADIAESNATDARRAARETNQQKEEVNRQKVEVVRQYLMSTSRLLAARSAAMRRENPVRSLLFAIEAISVTRRAGLPMQPLAYENLIAAVADVGGVPFVGHGAAITDMSLYRDGTQLLTTGADGTLRFWDMTSDVPTESRIPFEHPDHATAVTASANSSWVATACHDRIVHLWHQDIHESIELPTGGFLISQLEMSPDGHWLVAGGERGQVIAWKLDEDSGEFGKTPLTLSTFPPFRTASLSVSPDSQWLAAGAAMVGPRMTAGTSIVWNLSADDVEGSRRQLARDRVGVRKVAFPPDGEWLFLARSDNSVVVWPVFENFDLEAGYWVRLDEHQAAVQQLKMSADGSRIATADKDGAVIVWEWSDNRPVPAIRFRQPNGQVNQLAISPDGQHLAAGGVSNVLHLWNLAEPGRTCELIASASRPRNMLFTSDSQRLITGDNNYELRSCDVAQQGGGQHPLVLRSQSERINDGRFSPDDRFATSSTDGTVHVWAVGQDNPQLILTPRRMLPMRAVVPVQLAWSSDGSMLACVSNTDRAVRVWTMSDKQTVSKQRVLHGTGQALRSISFSPDDALLATGSPDGSVGIWSLGDEEPGDTVQYLDGHEAAVTGLKFHPTQKQQLASASADGIIALWDLERTPTQTTVLTIESEVTPAGTAQLNGIDISRDGRWLTASGRNHVTLWDLSADSIADSVRHLGGSYFTSVGFSSDQSLLAAGDSIGKIHIWQLTAAPIDASMITLGGHTAMVTAVRFSSDDSKLVSTSYDKTTRVWNLQADRLIKAARRAAGRSLRLDEYDLLPAEALLPALKDRLKGDPDNRAIQSRIDELQSAAN